MNIPNSMNELINEEQYRNEYDILLNKVLSDVCTPTNPIKITKENAELLLDKVYYGKL